VLMVTPLPSLWRLTSVGLAESERTVTLLTAAECRDKAEQKMAEAANNPALRRSDRSRANQMLPLRRCACSISGGNGRKSPSTAR